MVTARRRGVEARWSPPADCMLALCFVLNVLQSFRQTFCIRFVRRFVFVFIRPAFVLPRPGMVSG